MPKPQESTKPIECFCGASGQPAQAGCAQNFILMLGDALPAEKSAASRAPCYGFSLQMIVTTLLSDIGHRQK
jgi:hypothetical protein